MSPVTDRRSESVRRAAPALLCAVLVGAACEAGSAGDPIPPLTAGAIEAVASAASVLLSAEASTGGNPPYLYQWHGGTSDPGSAPTEATALAGLNSLEEVHSGLTNETTYFYRLVTTDDDGASVVSLPASATPSSTPVGPDLLLHEDWSGGLDTERWADGYRSEHHAVVNDPTGAGRGPVLRATHTDNGGASYLAHWIYGEGETNPTGEVFIRTTIYVPASFGATDYAKMLIIKGNRTDDIWSSFGNAGVRANGTNFFESYVTYGAPGHPEPGVHFYTYHVDMPENYGHYGYTQALPLSQRQPAAGQWHQFEFWLRQNTVGQSNGAQRMWIDGQLAMEWSGLRFRTDAILQANAIALTFSSANNQGQVWYVDDVYVYGGLPPNMPGW